MPHPRFDPLAGVRAADAPPVDVLVSGTVFLDIIFTGLARTPQPGTEEWADGMASCPGGIANLAIAARRLGLRTALASAFSDDDYGDFCWRTMESGEHIDLTHSRRFHDWHSPVTVSMSVERDRTMVTHGHPPPISPAEFIGCPPRSAAVLIDLAEHVDGELPTWVRQARSQGSLLFADVGWDATQRWDPGVLDRLDSVHAFFPNAAEAMAYTRTATAQDALYAIADRVPLAVVTRGSEGALAIDATSAEEAAVPALRVDALDPTGAGDVFGAALTLGTLAHWPLRDRLSFASLCSALAIQQFGGSLAAPGWGDIADWWRVARARREGTAYESSVARRYAFLDAIVPTLPESACRRATATIARRADVEGLG
ncbi:carbohydrate kinase family protein [Nostocoides sp.]|uniref:carbohydrate kinase family protein n=1 Tax=Nostocoides sp. TaxID=1917966 RepID=UPI003BAFDB48